MSKPIVPAQYNQAYSPTQPQTGAMRQILLQNMLQQRNIQQPQYTPPTTPGTRGNLNFYTSMRQQIVDRINKQKEEEALKQLQLQQLTSGFGQNNPKNQMNNQYPDQSSNPFGNYIRK